MDASSLEQLVLSGAIFNGGDESPRRNRSPSSSRSPSPFTAAAPPGDDTPSSGEDDEGYVASSKHNPKRSPSPQHESIGMGPGRTGVKGVIRDRDEARKIQKEKTLLERQAQAKQQKRQDFSVNDYFTELDLSGKNESNAREGDAWQGVEAWRKRRMDELKASSSTGAMFGHLREVGVGGFVEAVENVPRDIWVVLHIYDPSLNRCAILDSHLASLARRYPTVKFLRARAGAIGFAVSSSTSAISQPRTTTTTIHKDSRTIHRDPDESDSDHGDGYDCEDDFDGDEWEAEPDYDVLPTMLIYRGGELVHNWPRVDFDIVGLAGRGGGIGLGGMDLKDVEGYLTKYHIIQPSSSGGNAQRTAASAHDDEEEDEIAFASDMES